jgi:hypothetical protein
MLMQTKKSTKSAQQYKQTKGNFRFAEFLIIIFFLFLAFAGIALFRQDLLQTFSIQNREPAGIVIIKKNIVQRRLGDRVLWDRLANESPVYLGDLIRVAEISAASLDIDNNSIELDENTLIRISRSPDGEGFQIQLSSGRLSVSSGAGKSISLEVEGKRIQTNPGAVMNAAAGKNGISVQVNSGTVQVDNNGNTRRISSGEMLAMDAEGKELTERAAVVTRPIQNARYLKSANEPVPVNFEWNRRNFLPNETLRLEVALDRNFNQIFRVINGLNNQARVSLDAGLWYWRLSFGNTVLSDGRLSVADGTGPQLISPAINSQFRYRDEPPALNFQWTQTEDASSYIIEVSKLPDFSSTQIRSQIAAANYSDSSLGQGTWYWRVMPVFPAVYNGNPSFSQPAFFRIQQSSAGETGTERDSLEELLASVTPSKENLPKDVPPELVPPEWRSETRPEPRPERPPPILRLRLPAQGARLDGLTAMRQQTVFTWVCEENVVSSRFVLSRNSNPFQGRAERVIQNSGRTSTIRLDNLGEGTWYWNVEARTADGVTVRAPAARQFQVLPVPLLPPPENVSPKNGERYGLEELRTLKNIVFEWKTVQGANAYIFTLYQEAEGGRRQIRGTSPSARTSYVLDDLKLLENGTFIWQVEAVELGRNGAVERRGRTGEYSFNLDFPPPEPVQIEDAGILYGN